MVFPPVSTMLNFPVRSMLASADSAIAAAAACSMAAAESNTCHRQIRLCAMLCPARKPSRPAAAGEWSNGLGSLLSNKRRETRTTGVTDHRHVHHVGSFINHAGVPEAIRLAPVLPRDRFSRVVHVLRYFDGKRTVYDQQPPLPPPPPPPPAGTTIHFY